MKKRHEENEIQTARERKGHGERTKETRGKNKRKTKREQNGDTI